MDVENNTENKSVESSSEFVSEKSEHSTAFGIFLIILGLVSMLVPSLVTFSAQLILGIVLIFQGVFYLYKIIANQYRESTFIPGVLSALAILAGVLMLFNPIDSIISITVIIAIYFIVNGIMRFVDMFRSTGTGKKWYANLFQGILFIVFGFLVLSSSVMSSTIVIGFLLGILLIIEGITALKS